MKSGRIWLWAARTAAAVFISTLCVAPAGAQITATAPASNEPEDTQRFDVEVGAAYSHFNPGYAHQVRATNLEGVNASATTWLTKAVGLETTFRGLRGTIEFPVAAQSQLGITDGPMSEYVFLLGPRVRMYRSKHTSLGMHLLFGGAQGQFDSGFSGTGQQPFAYGIYNNQLAFAYAIGGYASYDLTSKLGIRVTTDYQPTFYGGFTQNEFAGTLGVVYRFGYRKPAPAKQ